MSSNSDDEISLICDSVARLMDGAGGLDCARRVHDGQGGDAALWAQLSGELMIGGLNLPDGVGGFDLGLEAVVAVSRELGRALAPVPVSATLGCVAPLLQAVGAHAELAEIASGKTCGALLAWDCGSVRAEQGADGLTLQGRTGPVPDLPKANLFVLPVRVDGALSLCVLRDIPQIDAGTSFDPTHPVGRVSFDGTKIAATHVYALTEAQLEQALGQARLVLAAEASGAARAAFEVTRAYMAERKQFDRPIASFQALKHRIARWFVALNALDALIDGAVSGIAAGDAMARAEAMAAWATARQLQHDIAAESIQLHGGVGVTWEYAPHLYFKRARAQISYPDAPGAAVAGIGKALMAQTLTSIPPVDNTPFRAEVRAWLDDNLTGRFAPIIGRGHAGDGETFVDLRKAWEKQMAGGGWVGIGLPKDIGGRGLSVADQVAFYEEYARAGGPGRMGHIGEGLVAPTLLAFGTKAQQARHLPGIMTGDIAWAQGYSEPSAGSDLAAVRCRAERDPDTGDWVVTGQKIWTSLAQFSDWIFVLARSDAGSVGRKGLIFLLMPLDQPGIETRPIKQMGGGAEFNEVFFDGAIAKDCDVLGQPGQGWDIAMALLGFERGISTLGQQMSFARELDAVVRLAAKRGATHLAAQLGWAWAGLRAMRHGAQRMLSAQAAGQQGADMLGYKLEWSEWHRALGELAMDALGGDAAEWSDDEDTALLQHLYLFSRADTIYGGTSEIQLNIIAEQGLGMPREPRGTK